MGEILGLTWECVDFETGFIHVKKRSVIFPTMELQSMSFIHRKVRRASGTSHV